MAMRQRDCTSTAFVLQQQHQSAARLQQQQQQQQDCMILLASTKDDDTTVPSPKPQRQRRVRYAGKYPRNFSDKYKELKGDSSTIEKVLAKGMTPAGTHVPILLMECLEHMGLVPVGQLGGDDLNSTNNSAASKQGEPLLVVDCTLGYGGHSSHLLKALNEDRLRTPSSSSSELIAFDQDSLEIVKTKARLLQDQGEGDDTTATFTAVNQNFCTLKPYLESTGQYPAKVTSLLADLGLSSMQIDDNTRGFTYKREGPLDMRMDSTNTTGETAYELLCRLKPKQLKRLLQENSDEVYAEEIAFGLLNKKKKKIPETTTELAARVRSIVEPLLLKAIQPKTKIEKRQLDSTVARVMQALRIELNGEFLVLEQLLEDLPSVLAPGGRAVFLTFHSGEDRRVKKAFKNGFKSGIYSSWSRNVVRPTATERRNNPRSSCCKLRWAVRAEEE